MSNIKSCLTASEVLKSLNNFDLDGVLIDVDMKSGKGFFPKLTSLGVGKLEAYEHIYTYLERNESFDVKKINVILVDVSNSEEYHREFMPLTNEFKNQKLPNYAMRLSEVKNFLESIPTNSVIIKNSYFKDDNVTYISPGFLGHYNNETYPLVDKQGKPVTAGLSNNQVATFTFIGKSAGILNPFYYTFNSEK